MEEFCDLIPRPPASVIGQLVELALRRDPLSGQYRESVTSAAGTVCVCSEATHRRIFQQWMSLSQEQRLVDLHNFQTTLPECRRNFAPFWITSDVYRGFAPCKSQSTEKAVYALEMRVALAVVDNDFQTQARPTIVPDRRVALILRAAAKGELHVRLSEIAKQLDLSPQHLGRLFAKEIGLPLRAYLAVERSRKATTLLCGEMRPVQSIAKLLGYANASNFINEFRSVFGCTPREYRNTYRSF